MLATVQPVPAPHIGPRCHAQETARLVIAVVFLVPLGADGSPGADPAPATAPAAPPAKIIRYARKLLGRYDRNADGRLEEDEWRKMPGKPEHADINSDGIITAAELVQVIAAHAAQHKLRLDSLLPASEPSSTGSAEPAKEPAVAAPTDRASPPSASVQPAPPARRDAKFHLSAKRLPPGLPDWFLRRDLDGDGQLILSEFAPQATAAERREFARYDLNSDGVVTPQEYLKATRGTKVTSLHAAP